MPLLLSEQSFSVVVLDILMPNLTGRELLPQIAQKYTGLPVVMLTALNEVDTAVDCMEKGAFDYLVKPVDKNRLVTTIKRAKDNQTIAAQMLGLTRSALNKRLSRALKSDM